MLLNTRVPTLENREPRHVTTAPIKSIKTNANNPNMIKISLELDKGNGIKIISKNQTELDLEKVCALTHRDIDLVFEKNDLKLDNEQVTFLKYIIMDNLRLNVGIIDTYSDTYSETSKSFGGFFQGKVLPITPDTLSQPNPTLSVFQYIIDPKEYWSNKQYYIENSHPSNPMNITYSIKRGINDNIIKFNNTDFNFKQIIWDKEFRLEDDADTLVTYTIPDLITKYGTEWDKYDCVHFIKPENIDELEHTADKIWFTQQAKVCQTVMDQGVMAKNMAMYPNPTNVWVELADVLKKHLNLIYPLAAITGERIPYPNKHFKELDLHQHGMKIVHFRQFNRGTCWAAAALNVFFIFFNKHKDFSANRTSNAACYAKYVEFERFLDVNDFADQVVKNSFLNRLFNTPIDGYYCLSALKWLAPNVKLTGFSITVSSDFKVFIAETFQKFLFDFNDMKPGSIYLMNWIGFNTDKTDKSIGLHAYCIHCVSETAYDIYDSNRMFTFNNIDTYTTYCQSRYNYKKMCHYLDIAIVATPVTKAGGETITKVYKVDLYQCRDNRKRKVFRIKGDDTIHANTLFTKYKGNIVRLRDIPKSK
jgi:hypothetical protein